MTTSVGRRTRQVDWEARTSGSARYTGDLPADGVLAGAILRSPHAHAEIIAIDTSGAAAMDGVEAVITADDLDDGTRYQHSGRAHADRPVLATGRVRFVGQEVVAVAARDRSTALRALEAIAITYRPRAAPLTPQQALEPGAAVLHSRPAGPNLAAEERGAWGDVEGGRQKSAVTVEGTFTYPRSTHVCMERSTTLARWTGNTLELWTTTQAPYYVAIEVAHTLGIDPTDVICHDISVGGGFGARSKICEYEVITALLARRSGQPVRIELTREEEFGATKTRHRSTVTTRMHATAEGRICLIEGDLLYENGAYNHSGPTVLKVGIKTMGSLYRPDAVTWRARLVDTAVQPGGQFRGYGGPQVAFALESQVDELAGLLSIDPIDLRIANANLQGSTALCGARIGSTRLVECLEAVRSGLDWTTRHREPRRPATGLGVAAGMHGSGSHVGPGTNESSAAVKIDESGRVRVRFGSLDAGTGQRTVCAQVAATELGVDPSEVTVSMGHGPDIPHDAGAWSSRGTHMAGHAVGAAARELAGKLRDLAATKLGGSADAVVLTDGRAVLDDHRVGLAELVRSSEAAGGGVLAAQATHHESRMEMFGADNPTPNFSASYTFCAHGAEVEVDESTGRIRVLDYVAAHDVGRAINPGAAEGQIIGGVVMALGAVLGEELIHEGGRPVNPAMLNYPLPRAADVPDVRTVLVEGPEEAGPYDAKSVGELPVYPVAAAVANAVHDAVGIRLRDLPFTPDKVIAALEERDGTSTRVHPLWRRPRRWWMAGLRALYPVGLHWLLHRYGTRLARRCPARPVEAIILPDDVDSILEELRDLKDATLVAGNTDLSLQRRQRLCSPVRLIAVSEAAELRLIERSAAGDVRIGAGATLSQLIAELGDEIPAMADAASSIASEQVRNAATLGGNLAQAKRCWFFRNGLECYKRGGPTCPCYAVLGDHRFHHAIVDAHRCQAVTPSDLATVLVALDATLTLRSAAGQRDVPAAELYSGPGEIDFAGGEIIAAATIGAAAAARSSSFCKLALWEGDFAMVSAAVSAAVGPGRRWRDTRIVLGAIAATPYRMRAAERSVQGREINAAALRGAVAGELERVAHPLANNGWKIRAAGGVAAQAADLLLARVEP
ncbi:MAG: molybdopterin-dependent oxidoreductase [Acidimicrobiaceae bacterium]|nr:molybdopterin-dependent oxidoreductase [Acidimicrobiaceae bacterium]